MFCIWLKYSVEWTTFFAALLGKSTVSNNLKVVFLQPAALKENSGSICFLSDINYGGLVDIKTVDPSAGDNKTTLSLCLLFANS